MHFKGSFVVPWVFMCRRQLDLSLKLLSQCWHLFLRSSSLESVREALKNCSGFVWKRSGSIGVNVCVVIGTEG